MSYDNVTTGSGVVPQHIVRGEIPDDSSDRAAHDVMLPEILRVPVHTEACHLLLRDPHRTHSWLLKLLLDVKPEHVKCRGVAIENRQGKELAFTVLGDHFLDQPGEIGAVSDPADAGQGGRLFLESRRKSRISQLDIEIILHIGAKRTVNHV